MAGDHEDGDSAHESDSLLSSNTGTPTRRRNNWDRRDSIADSSVDEDDNGTQAETTLGGTVSVMSILTERVSEFTETLQELAENLQDDWHDVVDNLQAELHDAAENDDKAYFLEMNLVRNLSVLPADMVDAANYVPDSLAPLPDPDYHQVPQIADITTVPTWQTTLEPIDESRPYIPKEVEEVNKERPKILLDDNAPTKPTTDTTRPTTPISAYLLLASAVLALSSIGPLLDCQNDVSVTMKVYWRTSATALVLSPFAARAVQRDGVPVWMRTHDAIHHWIMLTLTAGSYAGMCITFVWALEFTAVGNALIFSNSQSLMLLLGKLLVGQYVSHLEGSGAIVAFIGALLCSKDSSDHASTMTLTEHDVDAPMTTTGDSDAGVMATIVGDAFALGSALLGVAYLVLAKTIRPSMDLYVFMFFVMWLGSLETLLAVWIVGEPITIDTNTHTGIWGWVHWNEPDRLLLELAMVIFCNLFGAMGYVRAMHFFDNLVISVAGLMEPVVAECMAFSLGVGVLPGAMGWLGNFLVAAGTLAVVYQPGSGKIASDSH